jgi:pyruvate-ferredoxin/flavodoxin oxidoreductase
VDGTFPTGTARWEKRNLAAEIPVWDAGVCIQCGKCVFVCPHAVIRSKVYPPSALSNAPPTFPSHDARLPEWKGMKYTLQVAPEDCTGCALCVEVCPARNKSEARLKAINMMPQPPLRSTERAYWEFFLSLPDLERRHVTAGSVREMQTLQPLFEFSGACAGCGETPLSEVAHAIVRRSPYCGQRHGLFLHLWWQLADHTLGAKQGWPRARLVELAL